MPDDTAAQAPPATPPAASTWSDVHPKVAAAAIAGLVTSIVMPILKHYNIDMAGQEANITALVTVIAGYLMPAG